jgi:hypothetical protein
MIHQQKQTFFCVHKNFFSFHVKLPFSVEVRRRDTSQKGISAVFISHWTLKANRNLRLSSPSFRHLEKSSRNFSFLINQHILHHIFFISSFHIFHCTESHVTTETDPRSDELKTENLLFPREKASFSFSSNFKVEMTRSMRSAGAKIFRGLIIIGCFLSSPPSHARTSSTVSRRLTNVSLYAANVFWGSIESENY